MKDKSRGTTHTVKMTVDNVLYSGHFLRVDFANIHLTHIPKLIIWDVEYVDSLIPGNHSAMCPYIKV